MDSFIVQYCVWSTQRKIEFYKNHALTIPEKCQWIMWHPFSPPIWLIFQNIGK